MHLSAVASRHPVSTRKVLREAEESSVQVINVCGPGLGRPHARHAVELSNRSMVVCATRRYRFTGRSLALWCPPRGVLASFFLAYTRLELWINSLALWIRVALAERDLLQPVTGRMRLTPDECDIGRQLRPAVPDVCGQFDIYIVMARNPFASPESSGTGQVTYLHE